SSLAVSVANVVVDDLAHAHQSRACRDPGPIQDEPCRIGGGKRWCLRPRRRDSDQPRCGNRHRSVPAVDLAFRKLLMDVRQLPERTRQIHLYTLRYKETKVKRSCQHFSLLAGPHPRSLSLGGAASRRFTPSPRSGRRRFPFYLLPFALYDGRL